MAGPVVPAYQLGNRQEAGNSDNPYVAGDDAVHATAYSGFDHDGILVIGCLGGQSTYTVCCSCVEKFVNGKKGSPGCSGFFDRCVHL